MIALLDIYDYFGLLSKLEEDQRKQWARYLRGFQDRDSGLFVDRKNRRGIVSVKWSEVEEYDTARSIDGLKLLGAEPWYSLRQSAFGGLVERFRSPRHMLDWIDSLDWNHHPWGAATAVQQVMAILQESDLDKAFWNGVPEAVCDYLVNCQDPDTGLWGGVCNKPDESASATYKVFIIFGEFGWRVPRRELISEWAYHRLVSGEAPQNLCMLRNRVCLLMESWMDRSGLPQRMSGARAFKKGLESALAAGRLTKNIKHGHFKQAQISLVKMLEEFRAKDNGYSFHGGGRATSHHNGVILCKGKEEGDFLAVSNAAFCHAALALLDQMLSR